VEILSFVDNDPDFENRSNTNDKVIDIIVAEKKII
jgi:hypothetical protein